MSNIIIIGIGYLKYLAHMKNIILQFLLTVFFLFISPISLISQTHHDPNHNHERCGTMGHLERMIEKYPEIIENRAKIEAHTQKVLKNKNPLQKIQSVITIPVVVHVLYHTIEENISDAQIFSQIAVLNEDFRRLNADASNTPADFLPVAADSEIEFCLATRDPNGNPTTGITRTYTARTSWPVSPDVASSSQGGVDAWNTSDYLNVIVCNLGGGTLGFAQFPNSGPAATDGVVCNYRYFGNAEYAEAPFDLGRTMTHEVGHWLNLYHIWGDGDCTVDDLVADTPNAASPNLTGLPCIHGSVNSCDDGIGDLPDMFQNYMDYSQDACFNLFTTGQKDRMRALFEPGGFRESILSSTGCDPLPTHCSNNTQDNDETDVDCGGSCLPCVSCSDGIQNGEEAGIDCGGSNCMPCSGCTDTFAHNYSAINETDDGSCITCSDNIQNADETGIDCGGSFCLPCRTDALELSCGDVVTGSTNSNINNNLPVPCEDEELSGALEFLSNFGGDYFNNGVWVSFIGTGDLTFLSTDHAGTNSNFLLQVLVESGDDLVCVAWDIYEGELNFVSELGATYYVYLSDVYALQGDFELSMECVPYLCSNGIQDGDETGVDCGGSFCNACNDLCEEALSLENGVNLFGSTSNSNNEDLPTLCGEDVFFPNNGIWFTFEGTGGEITLSTDHAGTNYDTNLQLYSGDCDDLVCVTGNEDGNGDFVFGFTSEITFTSETGAVYYLYLSGYGGEQGDFELLLSAETNTLPINISHNRVCDVPTEGQSQVTVTITGGTAPYQVSGNFNGEIEEGESFIFILDDNESSYDIIVVDANGEEAEVLETDLLPCTKLPVELLAFEGEVQTEGNLLQWTTASELNNQHFRLSYSVNGQNFLSLQKIEGNGTSSTANRYEFLHRNAPKGTTYYQLSQTDFDGTTKDLGVISLKRGENTAISSIEVYPTPTNAQLNIAYNFVNSSNATTLKVYDLTGRMVKSRNLDSNSLQLQLQLNVADLNTGTYILRIENGLEILTTKFVKF